MACPYEFLADLLQVLEDGRVDEAKSSISLFLEQHSRETDPSADAKQEPPTAAEEAASPAPSDADERRKRLLRSAAHDDMSSILSSALRSGGPSKSVAEVSRNKTRTKADKVKRPSLSHSLDPSPQVDSAAPSPAEANGRKDVRSEAQAKKVQFVTKELFETERAYIKDLHTLVDVFKKPMLDKSLLTPEEAAMVFSNAELLIQVNEELLRQLESINQERESVPSLHLSEEEMDRFKAITCLMKITVQDPVLGEVVKSIPINGTTTFAEATALLVKKLDPLLAEGSSQYANYVIKHAETKEEYPENGRILESLGFKKTDLNFVFRRDLSRSKTVGDALLSMAEYLKIYTEYCSNQIDAIELITRLEKERSELKSFLRACLKDKRCRLLDLNAFLIMPLQRVCKYPLLLRELLSATPVSHPEYSTLNKASTLINNSVATINERKREKEGLKTMRDINSCLRGIPKTGFQLISPTRRYVGQGRVGVILPKNGEKATGLYHLFSDLILITSALDENKEKTYYAHLDLKNGFVNPADVEDVPHSFRIARPGKDADCITLFGKNDKEKKKLFTQIQEQIMADAYQDWLSARARAGSQDVLSFQEWKEIYGKIFM